MSGDVFQLEKGDEFNLDLTKYPSGFSIGLAWDPNANAGAQQFDGDLVLAVLDSNRKLLSQPSKPKWLVFYNNLATPNREITLDKDNRDGKDAINQGDNGDENATINAFTLPDDAAEVQVVALIHKARERKQDWGMLKGRLFIRDSDRNTVANFDFKANHTGHTSIEVGSFVKTGPGRWKFVAHDVGHNRELAEFIEIWK